MPVPIGTPSNNLQSVLPIPLSPVESYFWRFEQDVAGAMRVAVLLRFEGHIEAEYLALALRQLQFRHPKLRAVVIEGEDRELRYHFDPQVPPVPFEITDYEGPETPWREKTRELLESAFPKTGPLAAVYVLRSHINRRSELIFSITHAIADGLSAIMLVDSLLVEYAKAEAQQQLAPGSSLPVFTAHRAKSSSGWQDRMHLLWKLVQHRRDERRFPTTPLPQVRDVPPHSQWVRWVFSREETLRFVKQCRKQRTSLNGLLVGAACRSLLDCLPVSDAMFRWQLPFDVRKQLDGPAGPVTMQDLGCFMGNMKGSSKTMQQQSLWDLARGAHREFQRFVQLGGPSFSYNAAWPLHTLSLMARRLFTRPVFKPIDTEKRRDTILATNYGVLQIRETYGSLRPCECTLIMKNDLACPSLVIEALVLGQEMNIGFAGDDLAPEFWEKLKLAFRSHLSAVANGLDSSSPPDSKSKGGVPLKTKCQVSE